MMNKNRVPIRSTEQEIQYLKNKYVNEIVEINESNRFLFKFSQILFYPEHSRFFVGNFVNKAGVIYALLLPIDSDGNHNNSQNDSVYLEIMNVGDKFRRRNHPDNMFRIIPS